jgi:hypothetical protein
MKKILLTSTFVLSFVAFAGPECTNEPKEKWQDQNEFQKARTDEGYKIRKFKITDGNCYEIYGWNKEGEKVEIYYNPVTAQIVKKKIK